MTNANESVIVSGRSPPPQVVTRRATDPSLIGNLPERASRGEATAMSPEDAADASSREDTDGKGLSVTIPSIEAPRDASRRGGRIDFDTATDLVDQASQESFPASDSPAWTFLDVDRREPQRDWTMSKKNIINSRHEQNLPTSETSQAREGRGEIDSSKAGRERVAALAYELWESHGRPEGTDLEDWFQAELPLRRHT
jgi:hypothetical protein